MHVTSHIRRIAVIAIVGCAITAGWTGTAAARPLYDRPVDTTPAAASATEPHTVSASESSDWTLPIVVAGAVVIVLAGALGYSHRSHANRRVTA
ncbi:MAG TPA: hypothetical protein VFX51_02510 [Solirubrobacteraceae bacterium]|nr:hypothetical protein [Solirubrobacteraceae bacterium]